MKCKIGLKNKGRKCAKKKAGAFLKKHNFWAVIFTVLIIATIIDLVVPDPLPFVDEILLIFGSIFTFYKSVGSRK
jgi:hypothetical protein